VGIVFFEFRLVIISSYVISTRSMASGTGQVTPYLYLIIQKIHEM